MTLAQIIVNITGVVAILWIVWYFWMYKKEGVSVNAVDGIQQMRINVKGGYDPDVIVVKKGQPVQLHFTRQESSMCSEMVVFDKLGKSARLPEGETVTIEFTPQAKGEIPFACQMAMLRGKVIVTD